MATVPRSELLTVEEFLDIDFGDRKAELDNGHIRMMAGGSETHARVQGNIFAWLRVAMRGSGCRPYGSDMGVRTRDTSLRYPDVSVFCGHDRGPDDRALQFDDPKVLIEVLSPSTSAYDLSVKLGEYRQVDSVDTILFVDTEHERVRAVQRTGPEAWTDTFFETGTDIPLPSLGLTLPAAEIFARD